MTHTRIAFYIAGGHVHTAWWSATITREAELAGVDPRKVTHGKNGDLTFSVEEWEAVSLSLLRSEHRFEIVEHRPSQVD